MHRIFVNLCLGLTLSSVFCGLAVAQKPLAPGVLVTIPVSINPRDSFSLPMTMPDLEAPNYDPVYLSRKDTLQRLGQRIVFFHDIWEYEFSFVGGLRQAILNVPDLETNTTTQKNIWYIIYRIRDRGNTVTYEQVRQSPQLNYVFSDLRKDQPIPAEQKFFLPQFFLEGYVMGDSKEGYRPVQYHDKIIPMGLRQIQRRHDPSLTLLDPVQMSQATIPLAQTDADGGLWGAALFEDVDPRIDFVNLKVEGLSNAFRLSSQPDQPSLRKTLQLNFWRPGGIVGEHKDRIDYGIPLVDDPQKQVLITQRYDLPGPVLRCYYIHPEAAERRVLIAEVDAKFDLRDFSSALTPALEKGRLPAAMADALAKAGADVDPNVALEAVVPGKRWSFSRGEDRFDLIMEPQYWEPVYEKQGPKIRFIKSLDHLWIYR
jgi:hypothetical protein